MRFVGLAAFLVIIALVGAYITRPDEGWHRGVVRWLVEQGKLVKPASPPVRYAFEDFYLVTVSVASSGDQKLVTCWGAFTRFLCVAPARTGQGSAP